MKKSERIRELEREVLCPAFSKEINNMLREIIRDNIIYEGMYYTHSIERVFGVFVHDVNEKKIKIIPNKIRNKFEIVFNDLTKAYYDTISQKLHLLGWFVNTMQIKYSIKKDNKIVIIDIKTSFDADELNNIFDNAIEILYLHLVCEARYDIELSVRQFPTYLYHISQPLLQKKIKLKGLIPKSSHKANTNHPDRVYLVFSLSDAKKLAEKFKHATGYNTYDIYEIKTNQLQMHFKYFQDPNFVGQGCWTYNNIAPYDLKLIDTITV